MNPVMLHFGGINLTSVLLERGLLACGEMNLYNSQSAFEARWVQCKLHVKLSMLPSKKNPSCIEYKSFEFMTCKHFK